jgi:hypothetical protein
MKGSRIIKKGGLEMSGRTKQNLKKLAHAAIVGLALATGVKEAKSGIHKRYFPLSVGNSWTYTNGLEEKTFTIIGTQEINGQTYYKFNDYFNVGIGEASRTVGREVLVRFDTVLRGVLMHMNGEDIIRYNFAEDGWIIAKQWCRLKQRDSTCSVPAGEFCDCINFQFVGFDAGADCYGYGEYLAPDVGLVKYVVPGGACLGTDEQEGDIVTFQLQSYAICGDPNHPYPVGDLNYDCKVDLRDLAIFAFHWLECTAPECD